jgi:serine/threonine protein phosphatase PrpC
MCHYRIHLLPTQAPQVMFGNITMENITWQVVGSSVQGTSHIRQGLPNQDALHYTERQAPLVLAVADGHGSAKCFRSQQGAQLAVQCAVSIMQERVSSALSMQDLRWLAEENLSKTLVQNWRYAVAADVQINPFNAEEQPLLPRNQEPYLAYGSTLLVAVLTSSALLLMQLGDGDILVVSADGHVQRPIEADPQLIGNETTSLCGKDSWKQFRTAVWPLINQPALIVLATDGYANSFKNEASFLRVGSDLLAMIQQAGLAAVAASLPSWLQEASEMGSGDDVTVGLMYAQAKPPTRYVLASKRPMTKRASLTTQREPLKRKRTRRNVVELCQLFSESIRRD